MRDAILAALRNPAPPGTKELYRALRQDHKGRHESP